ncbi:NUDIX domain-containing protein [Paenibacillaceae bacterium]|nr:NUDIX domain-containing protein [Paenibacillaceae bacterium]
MTIRTRLMASAFLFHGEQLLLMKKQASQWQKQTEPFYSAIGGHLEPVEINDPLVACYREIEEETGLRRGDLHNLRLKYILLRLKEDEIRQQYVYVGETKRTDVVDSEEGQLLWHPRNALRELRSSFIMHAVLAHYLNNPGIDHVLTGTMSVSEDGMPVVQWNPLIDPGVF